MTPVTTATITQIIWLVITIIIYRRDPKRIRIHGFDPELASGISAAIAILLFGWINFMAFSLRLNGSPAFSYVLCVLSVLSAAGGVIEHLEDRKKEQEKE